MKKSLNKTILFGALALTTNLTGITCVSAKYIPVSKSLSKVSWKGSKGIKMLGEHYGNIEIENAKVDISEGQIKKAEIEIDMSTITNEDLDGGLKDTLIGHLKSGDFFDVENHKTAKFTSNKVKLLAKDKYQIDGHLTIKGIKKPISFVGKYTEANGKHKLTGNFVFDRTDYKIQYGSGQFFTNLGDKMIHDDVQVSFDLITQ